MPITLANINKILVSLYGNHFCLHLAGADDSIVNLSYAWFLTLKTEF